MIHPFRRSVVAIALACAASSGLGQTPSWPSRPIRVLIPFNAGAATDIVARAVLERVSAQLGQPIVIENKPGAGGTIASSQVASANPDGYTLLVHSNTFTVLPWTYKNLNYDPINDLVGVAALASVPMVFVTGTQNKARSLRELVAKASNGQALNCANAGTGGATHLGSERLAMAANFKCVNIPYRGSGEAMTDVIAGRADYYLAPVGMALGFVKQNKLVPLAVSSTARSPAMPDVPTTSEAGYQNADYGVWHGMFAPAKTPRAILERLNQEVAKAVQSKQVKDRFGALVVEPMPMAVDQFAAFLKKDFALSGELVKAAKVEPN